MTKILKDHVFPVFVVLFFVVAIWYAAAVWLNYDVARSLADEGATRWDVVALTMQQERPLLPAPHQIVEEFVHSFLSYPFDSPKNILYHSAITAFAAGIGFMFAVIFGIMIAVGIVHIKVFDRALMPWVIASQTVPVLAIAPMVVVVLGNVGLTGLLPKSLISGYLSFFPITTSMVAGLRSPNRTQIDLMRTYSSSNFQIFVFLRFPASIVFLFPSMKIAATLSLVGAIVAELPTGAQAGLGARLLSGSYYGQTLQIWTALFAAALLSLLAVSIINFFQYGLIRGRGGKL